MNTRRMSDPAFLIGQIAIMMNVLLMHLEDIDLLLSKKSVGQKSTVSGFMGRD